MTTDLTTTEPTTEQAAGRTTVLGRLGAAGRRVPRGVRVAAVLLVLAVAAALVAFWPGTPGTTVTAQFTRTVGLYEGSDVRVLGVRVGEVVSVTPAGDVVDVVIAVDGEQPVPADVRAAVISPSVVGDRFVQLLPAYTGGDRLQDGDTIPTERTAVPVELDRVYSSLDDLMTALGPDGANADGALSRALATGAANLDGQGEALGSTVRDLSLAVETLAGGDDDLFGTIRNLQVFTSTLAGSDAEVRELNANLASVSDQLSGEREDLAAALENLAVALGEVSGFVRDNRQVLGDDLAALEEVTASVVAQQDAYAETLVNGPLALGNLNNAYNAASGTLDTRNNHDQENDPALFVCSLLHGAAQGNGVVPEDVCGQLLPAVGTLLGAGAVDLSGLPLDQLSRVPAVDRAPAPAPARDTDRTLGGILDGGAP